MTSWICCKRCGVAAHVKNRIVRGFQRYHCISCEFATAEPVIVTEVEPSIIALSAELGAAPDCQSAAFDQSPAVPVSQVCVNILVNTSKRNQIAPGGFTTVSAQTS
jgi:hypothetical protein